MPEPRKHQDASPMMAGSHVALGVAAWMAVSPHLGFGPAGPAGVAIAAAASLLPDIDHPKSWLGRHVRPVSEAISYVFGHRGITHSALAVAACGWVVLHNGAPLWAADATAVGYASHLAADLLTPSGLRLAWPVKRTWALPLCRTGGQAESLVVAALVWWAASGALVPPPLAAAWRHLQEVARPAVAHGAAGRRLEGRAVHERTTQRAAKPHEGEAGPG